MNNRILVSQGVADCLALKFMAQFPDWIGELLRVLRKRGACASWAVCVLIGQPSVVRSGHLNLSDWNPTGNRTNPAFLNL